MIFEPMGEIFPDEPMWGAHRGDYSYIISEVKSKYYVSARRAYTTEPKIIPGQLINIGEFTSMRRAVEACMEWKP
jgi:hypothetical protein